MLTNRRAPSICLYRMSTDASSFNLSKKKMNSQCMLSRNTSYECIIKGFLSFLFGPLQRYITFHNFDSNKNIHVWNVQKFAPCVYAFEERMRDTTGKTLHVFMIVTGPSSSFVIAHQQ